MRSYRKRAYSLVHLICLLPLIAAVSTSGVLLARQVMSVRAREYQYIQSDAAIRDLVRRIENDAGRAASASVRTEGDACELQLSGPQDNITYRSSGERLQRTATATGQTPVTVAFDLATTRVKFQIEDIKGKPGIVWTTFVRQTRAEAGPIRTWRLSAGATINRGGRP